MCGSSKSETRSNQTVNQVQTQRPETPAWLGNLYQDYAGSVGNLMRSDRPFVAGASDLQNRAFQGAANLTTPGQFGLATGMAAQAGMAGPNLTTSTGYTAERVDPNAISMSPAERASARSFTDVDLSGYMNTGLNDVISALGADLDAQAGMTRAQQTRLAALNGGARNSNNAIREAVTEGELARARNAGMAGARFQAFDSAANLANADLGREASLSQFNAGQANQMAAQEAAMRMQGLLSNQAAANQASQFGAAAANQAGMFNASQIDQELARRLQAAGLLGDLGNTIAGNQRADIALQGDLGAEQRNIQNAINQGDYARLLMESQLLNQIPGQYFVGSTGTLNGTTQGTQTTTQSPSLLQSVGGLAMGLGGLGWSPFGASAR